MYPSSTNNNDNGCMPQRASFFGNYYNNDNAPSSPSFLVQSPIYMPLEDEAVFCQFFQQQQQFVSNDHHNHHNMVTLEHEMPNTMKEYSNNNRRAATNNGDDDDHCELDTQGQEPEKSSPRKRLSKRDRHSKINTAQGPRDRRMRLSLDVAKKLFGLQDLLGFDKASKTVDWLLTQSKTAILELLPDPSCSFMDVSNSASSTSECEVMSGTADQFMGMTGDDQATINDKTKSCSGSRSCKKKKDKVSRVRKCTDFHHPLAKASRERARERARERTIEKRNNINHGGGYDSISTCLDQAVNQLGSWNTFPENQHQNFGQMSSDFHPNQGFVSDNSSCLLMTDHNWTPSYAFNYPHSSGLTHELQFNHLQINVKEWEGNNN